MPTSRRDFLRYTAAAGAVGLGLRHPQAGTTTVHQGGASLRILVLGGTGFIGPHMVRRALSRGHTLTLFNRGRTNVHLFPEVEKLIGDREGDLEALKGRTWDVVIDNSAINPKWVRDSAQLLQDSVDRYFFTSTRSVYADFSMIGMDETSPLHEVDSSVIEEGTRVPYGPSKVLCEREVQKAFPNRTLIVRPGIIVGPGDRSDRFTYWPARIDRGGEVLAPGDPTDPVMFIDVRDLADWYIHMVEQGTLGVYNALGPEAPLSFAEMLYGIRAVTSAYVSFTWVEADFLLEREVRQYADVPLWYAPRGNRVGFQRFNLSRPLGVGLKYRPLAVTALDTLEWHKTRPEERRTQLRVGLSAEREAELLEEWHAK